MTVEHIPIEAVEHLCATSIEHYRFTAKQIESEVYRDPWLTDEDIVVARRDDGSLAGIIAGVVHPWIYPLRATIQLFVVDRDEQGSGLAQRIYEQWESRLSNRHVKEIEMLGGGTYYLLPGLDMRHKKAYKFLLRNGFERIYPDRVNMVCDLANIDYAAEQNLPADIKVRRAVTENRTSLFEFIDTHFGKTWAYEVDRSFSNSPPTVYMATDSREDIVGFAAYCAGYGRFGPMGTLSDYRNMGVGRTCLYKSLKSMRDEMGYAKALIPWVGPTDFYRYVCGATIDRSYCVMKKRLGTSFSRQDQKNSQ